MLPSQSLFRSCCLLLCILARAAEAAPVIELTTDEKKHVGKSVAHNQKVCWLANPDGSYARIHLPHVNSFRKLEMKFRPRTAMELRSQLLKTFRGEYEVAIKGSYVVCAPIGKAKSYAALFDQVARSFSVYFSRRGFRNQAPEYPLVALILKSREDFKFYCEANGQSYSPLLQGYYHPYTNRVVLFETPEVAALRTIQPAKPGLLIDDTDVFASVDGGFRDTIIHEAIHQLAFNTGLHSRIGKNPRWVVEGLAMMLEVDSNRGNAIGSTKSRVNPERLDWFLKYRQKLRTETIADFIIEEEKYFSANILHGYAQAWALTYFLAETRSSEYADYLGRVSARNPLSGEYSSANRLADFQASFGDDLKWLEVQFMRFYDELE